MKFKKGDIVIDKYHHEFEIFSGNQILDMIIYQVKPKDLYPDNQTYQFFESEISL